MRRTSSEQRVNRATATLLVAIALLVAMVRVAPNASAADRFIDQAPYDLLTLKQDAQSFQLVPLELAERVPLREQDRQEWLVVQLAKRPDQKYQIRWRDIDRVQLFEELVLEEAVALTDKADYDEAHACYRFVERRAPRFPGLDAARHQTLYREAEHWLGRGEYANALALVNELYDRAPRHPELMELSGRVVDRLVENYLADGKHVAARELIDGLAAKYATHRVVKGRRQQLIEVGEKAYRSARTATDAGQLHQAQELLREARLIWPDSQAVRELTAELNATYPVVRVGVRELRIEGQPSLSGRWATERCKSLLDRRLFQAQAFGDDGGTYHSQLVSHSNEDGQTVLTINEGVQWPDSGQPVSSLDVARLLTSYLLPTDFPTGRDSARSIASIRTNDENGLTIDWRLPRPKWQALMDFPVQRRIGGRGAGDGWQRLGRYELALQQSGTAQFHLRDTVTRASNRQPREISERVYRDTLAAIRALRQQEIHAYDRVVPWDVAKVRAYEDLQLVQYAAPTVHWLVPNPASRLMSDGVVRRALSFALDREFIVAELLGAEGASGGAPLSGPFPRGYGSDQSIPAHLRDAPLAASLLNGRFGDPGARTLTLVHSPDPVQRRAAQALRAQLQLDGLGFDLKLVESNQAELATGPKQEWDLWYVTWNALEPCVDAGRLCGPGSLISQNDPWLGLLAQQVDSAADWDATKAALQKVHRRVDQQLAIIPLWQLDEFALIHRSLRGCGEKPVSLYQHVERWEVDVER